MKCRFCRWFNRMFGGRLEPYKNWNNQELKETLLLHVNRLAINPELRHLWRELIHDAFNNKKWSPMIDYNGCTAVQDYGHPDLACFVHDYMWICGHGGRMSDRIFYHLMRASGMTKPQALRRWVAVRIGWFTWFMWKYIKRRNWEQPTDAMKNMNNYIVSLRK